jgi:guanine nucleotide exchange protein RalF
MLNKDLAGAIMATYQYDELPTADKKAIIAAFNTTEKEGIKLLGEKLNITDSAKLTEEKARFFIAEKTGLDLDAVGDYLGTNGNQKTLEKFLEQQNYQKLEFTGALRQFLTSFNLPGEAQKIDRLMQAFAARYAAQNPTAFENQDAAYVLAFSTIMLNTDQHNPEVKNKMTLEGFIKNNRGINDGKDFPQDFLTKIYHEINQNALKPNITKVAPGFTINLNKATFNAPHNNLKKCMRNSGFSMQKALTDLDSKYTADISKPKKWLHQLLGYEGTITIKEGIQAIATVQIYSPGLLSRNKNPKIIVQPSHDGSFKPKKEHVQVAARIAISFGVAPIITATYDYQKDELREAFATHDKLPGSSSTSVSTSQPSLLHLHHQRELQRALAIRAQKQRPLLGPKK